MVGFDDRLTREDAIDTLMSFEGEEIEVLMRYHFEELNSFGDFDSEEYSFQASFELSLMMEQMGGKGIILQNLREGIDINISRARELTYYSLLDGGVKVVAHFSSHAIELDVRPV
ncbi:hypothetical protein [Bacillus toyonensis]|uniref:hypothetical protein n=1 Tax=Bacillus toyonensis TaxID=155322 RepID=UPI00156E5A0B|nr:hypothetical protein [Bacillus toyonensis]NSL68292.1 hypothetical protein [Bacillus toyonensis]